MTRLLRNAVSTVAFMIAAPVWAHVPTAEELNRQELYRLANARQAVQVAPAAPFVADPVGLIAADGPWPASSHFPGLLTLGGAALAAGGVALDTVLMGDTRE